MGRPLEQARPDRGVGGLPGGLGLTELVAVLGGGGDATPGNLHVLAAGPAVELVQSGRKHKALSTLLAHSSSAIIG